MKRFIHISIFLGIVMVGLCAVFITTQAQTTQNCTFTKSSDTIPNNPPCKLPNGEIYTKKLDIENSDSTYYPLQPLPCDPGSSEQCEKSGQLETFDPSGENNKLGEYLNTMIHLFLGLCAVLAVIMIVIGGIEYAGSELISSKSAAREKITGAIFGLVLALGAWTILYTINPDLLKSEVDVAGVTLASNISEFEVLSDWTTPNDTGPIPTGSLNYCKEGMVKTRSGMYACKSIADNLDAMIDAAKRDKVNITGRGYRTVEEQFKLRTKYCGAGNEYNPNARCSRPTALPGRSRHQNGIAFDLKCDGVFIPKNGSGNPCFRWLQANASKYGLYNLPSEGWHWSVDGK